MKLGAGKQCLGVGMNDGAERVHSGREMCPLPECPLGLTAGDVAVSGQDVERLMKTVFGDGDGNKGLLALTQRREGQLSLLIWLFGPSSILGLLIGIVAFILQARGH